MFTKLDPVFRFYTHTNSERTRKLKVKSRNIKALKE